MNTYIEVFIHRGAIVVIIPYTKKLWLVPRIGGSTSRRKKGTCQRAPKD
jgi:hypothetical protein